MCFRFLLSLGFWGRPKKGLSVYWNRQLVGHLWWGMVGNATPRRRICVEDERRFWLLAGLVATVAASDWGGFRTKSRKSWVFGLVYFFWRGDTPASSNLDIDWEVIMCGLGEILIWYSTHGATFRETPSTSRTSLKMITIHLEEDRSWEAHIEADTIQLDSSRCI